MPSVILDQDNFFRRMKRLYTAWKEKKIDDELFPEVDSICTAVGSDDCVLYRKSISLQTWLLGYDLNDVIMILSENSIHFLASKKKIEFLRPVERYKDENSIPPIKLHVRSKEGSDKENFEKLIAALKTSGKGKTLGVFVKDEFAGPLVESWKKTLSEHSFENVDISNALACLLSVKEETELSLVKKSCQATVNVYHKYLRDQIRNIIDSDKKVKHAKLAEGVENAMTDEKYVGSNIDTSKLTTCYPPIIQSGGNYTLKFSAQSDQKNLHFGVIICFLGARYKMYCSSMIRTLLVNPNESVQENYTFLVDLLEHLISILKSGIRLCDVYNSGINYAREKKPSLVENLTKNFGFVTGIEFRENSLTITPKTTACAKECQVYILYVGLSNLIDNDADSKEDKKYSLCIGETVVVNKDDPATVLTNSKKQIKNVGIFLKDESDDEEEKDEKENQPQQLQILERGKRTAVLESKLRHDASSEEKRKQHQKELKVKLNEEALQRLSEKSNDAKSECIKKSKVSYENYDQMSQSVDVEVKQLKIFVDKKCETVILPIFGLPVPFHISVIKNISESVEGDYTYLRINFFHLGAAMAKPETSQFVNPDATFTKEVTYRNKNVRESGETSASSANLNNAFRLIKEVLKKYKTKEAEEKEKEDLVKQDTLIISSNKENPMLKDLYLKPTIVKKKVKGCLEAHVNGFRYTSVGGEKVDLLYNNIENAFFQPCDGEMIILLHFHLKNAIMFGKKKYLDLQFYTEVGETTTDLNKYQHIRDRDALAAEQIERELRHKLKMAFKSFCEKVSTATGEKIEFETPLREHGFTGSPNRSNVLLQPTSGKCLVNLTEWPPFIISLEDIEIVHFERVDVQLKNFDMVFVFKDYRKKVTMIDAIPMNMLNGVEEWLNNHDITYYKGLRSLAWPKILKIVMEDREEFFRTGGWTKYFDLEGSADESGDEVESSDEDEAYEPTDVESIEQDSDDDSTCSEGSEDSDSEEEELDSSEESGKDWSDLEHEAETDDRQLDANSEESVRNRDRHHKSPHSSNHHSSSLQSLKRKNCDENKLKKKRKFST